MLRNMIFSYAIIAIIAVGLTSTVIAAWFQSREMEQIRAHSEDKLRQADQTALLIVEQANIVGNQALSDQQLAGAMTRADRDYLDTYYTFLRLRKYKSSTILFSYLGVYNDITGQYISEGPLATNFQTSYKAALERHGRRSAFYMPEIIPPPYAGSTTAARYVITLIYKNQYKSVGVDSCFTISVDQSSLVKQVNTAHADARQGLFAIDDAGTVMSHMDNSMFLTSLADEAYISEILRLREQSGDFGSFTATAGGEASFVSYYASEALGWIFVNVEPYGMVAGRFFQIRLLIILVAAAVLLLTLLLTTVQSLRTYRPVEALVRRVGRDRSRGRREGEMAFLTSAFERLYDERRHMESALKTAQPILADSLYTLLLSGRLEDVPDGAVEMQESLQSWKGPFFLAAVFMPDIDALSEADGAAALSQLRQWLRGALAARAHAITKSRLVTTGADAVALIAQFGDEAAAVCALGELAHAAAGEIGTAVYAMIGGACRGLESIDKSYAQAQAQRTRIYTAGECEILLYEGGEGDDSDMSDTYPFELERQLRDGISCAKAERFESGLDAFTETISALSALRARHHMDQLMLSIYKHFYEFLSLKQRAHLVYPGASAFRTLSEDALYLHLVGHELIGQLRGQKAERGKQIAEQVMREIHARYADTSLSIDALAEEAGFSANYLGRVFKAATGEAPHSYLVGVRMERAACLLCEYPDMPIGKVSEAVGILNANYFYTVFKKRYGVTPTEYRQDNSNF